VIRTAFLLWRLCRELHVDCAANHTVRRAVELRVMLEPPSSYDARCRMAEACGAPKPERESMNEVSYWPVAGQPCYTQRGTTLAEALKKALAAPFPASLT